MKLGEILSAFIMASLELSLSPSSISLSYMKLGKSFHLSPWLLWGSFSSSSFSFSYMKLGGNPVCLHHGFSGALSLSSSSISFERN